MKTDFGWHVIQLREVKAGQQVPFEQVREQLAREQADADRERAFNDLSGKLVDLVYKNPTTLAPAARAVNLPVQKLGPIRAWPGTGIAANPAVQRAAFSDTLIQDGTVSDPIEIAPGHSVLIRVPTHARRMRCRWRRSAQQVIAAIRRDRAAKAAAAAADAMVAQLRAGKPLQELAAARQLQTGGAAGHPARRAVARCRVARPSFSMPRRPPGKVSPPTRWCWPMAGSWYSRSARWSPGNPQEATADQRAATAAATGADGRQQRCRRTGEDLRKHMKIKVAEDRL